MKCVVCGKTMETPKDTGATCTVCEAKKNPKKVKYCLECGSENVVKGTVFCKEHQEGKGH